MINPDDAGLTDSLLITDLEFYHEGRAYLLSKGEGLGWLEAGCSGLERFGLLL